MLRSWWHGPERRQHPRAEAALELSIEVELYGFSGDMDAFFASGRTVNLSVGGLLASVDAPLTAGSVCKVFFRDDAGQVRPRHATARVRRCHERDDGTFLVAVAFEAPLTRLELDQRASAMVGR